MDGAVLMDTVLKWRLVVSGCFSASWWWNYSCFSKISFITVHSVGGGEEKTRDGGHGWEVITGKGDKILKTWERYKGADVVDSTRKDLTRTG